MFTRRARRGWRSSRTSGARSIAWSAPVDARQPPPSRPERAEHGGERDDRPDGHRAVRVARRAGADADERRARRGELPRERLDLRGREPGRGRRRLGPVLREHPRPQLGPADRLRREEGLVGEAVAREDVDEAQGERAVGPGPDEVGPVGEPRGLVLPGLDEQDARAAPPRLRHPGGEVQARRDGVDAPQHDEIRALHRVGVRPRGVAHDRAPAGALRRRADRPVEPRRAEPVEERHPRVPLHEPHRARVRVREDRLGRPRARPPRRAARRRGRAPRPSSRGETQRHPSRPVRTSGWRSRSGEWTERSYPFIFGQSVPREYGCSGSPRTRTARPPSTSTRRPHASGQSNGHTERRTGTRRSLALAVRAARAGPPPRARSASARPGTSASGSGRAGARRATGRARRAPACADPSRT